MTLKTLFTVDVDLLPFYAIFLLIVIIVIIKGVISYKRDPKKFFALSDNKIIKGKDFDGSYKINDDKVFTKSNNLLFNDDNSMDNSRSFFNPSTGLPMINDSYDIHGNAYGMNDDHNIHENDLDINHNYDSHNVETNYDSHNDWN